MLLCLETGLVVLPLSLASLGDLPAVSLAGVVMMVVVAVYVMQQALVSYLRSVRL